MLIVNFNNMRKIILLFIVVGALLALPALAQEEISDFRTTIKINEDASIKVTEKITYDFGSEQKHGIYRDIPFKYQARGGNYNLILDVESVVDEAGRPYNFEVLKQGRNKRIKIGDADSFASGQKVYVIAYRAERALNYFVEHDELYWNATGNEWNVPIKQSKATVQFPASINDNDLQAACFAGYTGSAADCVSTRYEYSDQNVVKSVVFAHDRLDPGEGVTVVVGWPKDLVYEPTFVERLLAMAKDNWIIGMPFLIFALLFYLWRTRGRDPEGRGTIIAQFEAPDKLTPAEVGTIIDEKAHRQDVSAEIINLAVNGYLRLSRIEGKGLLKSGDYELEKLKEESDLVNEYEKKLMQALFSGGEEIIALSELKNKFYKDLEKITKEIYSSTVKKNYFPKSPRKVRGMYLGIGAAVLFGAWFTGIALGVIGGISTAISGIIIIIFSFFMPARTRAGVMAREHILGLKRYLTVAEKDRLKFHNAPEKDPKHFEKLLPYAMVLGVETEWAKQFEGIYDQQPSWYHDASGRHFTALALANSLGSFQANANTTMASRPSSASSGGSGFSGGGSGGGFGGGGGGSW